MYIIFPLQDDEDLLTEEQEPEAVARRRGNHMVVEILTGDLDHKKFLDQGLKGIANLPHSSQIYKELLTDIGNVAKIEGKTKMMMAYSALMQKTYSAGAEIAIKKILKKVIPKLINEILSWKHNEDTIGVITESDIKVIKYISGATLRWGLKRFKGIDQDWCRKQMSCLPLPVEFTSGDRGGLISPVQRYFLLMKEVEFHFRTQCHSKFIDIRNILAKVNVSNHYPCCDPNPIKILMSKFIRIRAYSHCQAVTRSHFMSKKLKSKRSKGLRDQLRSKTPM